MKHFVSFMFLCEKRQTAEGGGNWRFLIPKEGCWVEIFPPVWCVYGTLLCGKQLTGRMSRSMGPLSLRFAVMSSDKTVTDLRKQEIASEKWCTMVVQKRPPMTTWAGYFLSCCWSQTTSGLDFPMSCAEVGFTGKQNKPCQKQWQSTWGVRAKVWGISLLSTHSVEPK